MFTLTPAKQQELLRLLNHYRHTRAVFGKVLEENTYLGSVYESGREMEMAALAIAESLDQALHSDPPSDNPF